MLIKLTSMTRAHAATDCMVQSTAVGTWIASGRTANVAVTAERAKGTGTSTVRLGAAPQTIASLPFSNVAGTDVVGAGNTAGIRSWSPPV